MNRISGHSSRREERALRGFVILLAMVSLAGSHLLAATIDKTPVAHWTFDEGFGITADDASGNGHTATLYGGSTWTTGKVGSHALYLDGTGYAKASDSSHLRFPSALAVSMWVQTTSQDLQIFVNKFEHASGSDADDCFVLRASGGEVYAQVGGNSTTAAVYGPNITINDGEWHHLVLLCDATTAVLYVDTIAGTPVTSPGAPQDTVSPLYIGVGTTPTDFARYTTGSIDDVRIYNEALSLTDIQALYAMTASSTDDSSSAPTTDPTPAADTNQPEVTITPAGGTYTVAQTVTISATDDTDPAPVIYYTMDGTTPTTSSATAISSITFTVTEGTTFRYFAKDASGNQSGTFTSGYTIENETPPAADTTQPEVTITPAGGTYTDAQTVTLSATDDTDPAPVIYYTMDGTTPSTSSATAISSITFTVTEGTTFRYFAKDASGNQSGTFTSGYTIENETPTTPTEPSTPTEPTTPTDGSSGTDDSGTTTDDSSDSSATTTTGWEADFDANRYMQFLRGGTSTFDSGVKFAVRVEGRSETDGVTRLGQYDSLTAKLYIKPGPTGENPPITIYTAIEVPGGGFVGIAGPNVFLPHISPLVTGWTPVDIDGYSIVDLPLGGNVPAGRYKIHFVVEDSSYTMLDSYAIIDISDDDSGGGDSSGTGDDSSGGDSGVSAGDDGDGGYDDPSVIEEIIKTRDTTVVSEDAEDALVDALQQANQADAQTKMLYNAFYMLQDDAPKKTWLNHYAAMEKSFEIAARKYGELVTVHETIEANAAAALSRRAIQRREAELNVGSKMQWYLDRYGQTTPKGTKIDIKTIAKMNKTSMEKVYTLIKTQYGVISEQASASAAQYEMAAKTAEEVKVAADTANTALSFVAGGQAAYGTVKAYNAYSTAQKMYAAGQLSSKVSAHILQTQKTAIIKGAVDCGFKLGDGIIGTLGNPALKDKLLSTENQERLAVAQKAWSAINVAKGAYDLTGVFAVRDVAGKGKILLMDVGEAVDPTTGVVGNVISLAQDENGQWRSFTVPTSLSEGSAIQEEGLAKMKEALTLGKWLPNGKYVAVDENGTTEEFDITASKAAENLQSLPAEDRLIDDNGDVVDMGVTVDDGTVVEEPLPEGQAILRDFDLSTWIYDENYTVLKAGAPSHDRIIAIPAFNDSWVYANGANGTWQATENSETRDTSAYVYALDGNGDKIWDAENGYAILTDETIKRSWNVTIVIEPESASYGLVKVAAEYTLSSLATNGEYSQSTEQQTVIHIEIPAVYSGTPYSSLAEPAVSTGRLFQSSTTEDISQYVKKSSYRGTMVYADGTITSDESGPVTTDTVKYLNMSFSLSVVE